MSTSVQASNDECGPPLALLLAFGDERLIAEDLELGRRRYLGRMAQQLSAALTQIERSSAGSFRQGLRQRICGLPEEALLRILTAPETHCVLTKTAAMDYPVADFLQLSAAAEEARVGLRSRGSERAWSAIGDYYAPSPVPADQHTAPTPQHRPTCAEGIFVVDADSPHAYVDVEDNVPPSRYLRDDISRAQVAGVVSKLMAAVTLMRKANFPAFQLVQASLRVIVLLQDMHRPATYRTSSCRTHIGKAVFVNAHLDDVTTARIADSLVHEAIHSFLYEREQSGCWVECEEAERKYIESPWTGNLLRLDSYVQACFVWYALAKLWSKPEIKTFFEPEQVENLLGRSLSGFRGDVLAPVRQNSARIRSTVMGELEALVGSIAAELRRHA